MNKVSVIAAGAALLLLSATAMAETYRWVDAEGNVHYGDRPVRGAESVDIRTPGEAPASRPAPLPVAENDDGGEGDPGGDTDTSAGGDEAAQVRADLCKQAKERLANYEKADGIYEEDAQGQRRELTLDERVNTILDARQSVETLCAEPSGEETAL